MKLYCEATIVKQPYWSSYTSPETKKVYEGWKVPVDNENPQGEFDLYYVCQLPKDVGERLGFNIVETARAWIGKTVRFTTQKPRVYRGTMRLEFDNMEAVK